MYLGACFQGYSPKTASRRALLRLAAVLAFYQVVTDMEKELEVKGEQEVPSRKVVLSPLLSYCSTCGEARGYTSEEHIESG